MITTYAYRGSQTSQSPCNDTDYTMWALDREQVEHYTGEDQSRLWRLDISGAIPIDSLRSAITDALTEDIENGFRIYEMEEFVKDLMSQGMDQAAAIETICNSFNPPAITDGADAYDRPRLVEWLWDRVLDSRDILMLRTEDGAICFDPSLAENMATVAV